MSLFKTWENKAGCDTPIEVCELVEDCSACTQLKKEGWKAALEEVLKQLDIIYDGDFENSDIVKWIEKELKEE